MSLATEEMKANQEYDGWRYTPRGLDRQIHSLVNYRETLNEDSKPTQEQLEEVKEKTLRRLKREGITIRPEDEQYLAEVERQKLSPKKFKRRVTIAETLDPLMLTAQ